MLIALNFVKPKLRRAAISASETDDATDDAGNHPNRGATLASLASPLTSAWCIGFADLSISLLDCNIFLLICDIFRGTVKTVDFEAILSSRCLLRVESLPHFADSA